MLLATTRIILLQSKHPSTGFPDFKIHTDTTKYYIIDILNEKDSLNGPLTAKRFDSMRTSLKITDIPLIKLTQTFPNRH